MGEGETDTGERGGRGRQTQEREGGGGDRHRRERGGRGRQTQERERGEGETDT